jgi:uncharacterized membrane protein YccF (DUF307 family)
MTFIANLLWFILGGGVWGLTMFAIGLLWCITIVGIPVGVATFRFAAFVCFPFGREMVDARDCGEERIFGTGLVSFLWIIFFGLWSAIALGLTGVAYFCTIIGIPFGIAYLKIAAAAFNPLGKRIVSTEVAKAIRERKANAVLNSMQGK